MIEPLTEEWQSIMLYYKRILVIVYSYSIA